MFDDIFGYICSVLYGVFMKEGIEHIFQLYYPELVRFVERHIPDKDMAHDFVSDAFLRLYEEYGEDFAGFNGENVRAWLYKVVRNAILNYLRDVKIRDRHHVLLAESMLLADVKEDEGTENYIIDRVNAAIDALPQQCRLVVRMSALEGRKYQEIADILGMSINSVRTYILRGFKKLREDLSSDPEISRILSCLFICVRRRNRE